MKTTPSPSRATLVRAVLAAVVLLASVCIALTVPPRLGLDLQGGTRMVLQAKDTPGAAADRSATDRTIEVLRGRIDALGVAEPTLTRSGEDRIVVELPDVQDPRKAAEVLGRTAQLAFHAVEGPAAGDPAKDKAKEKTEKKPQDPRAARELADEQGNRLRLAPAAFSGAGVKDATARFDAEQGGGWYVDLAFRKGAGKDWAKLTGAAACHPAGDERRRVAVVLDHRMISSPQVDPSVACRVGIDAGATRISGSFTAEEAKELALLIKGGALPVPVEVVEQRTVGPTLGAAAIDASMRAAIIGAVLTAVFITVVYRLFGALASVALAAYGVISYAVLVALGVTLTLPGLAGFVLAIGMAVDANVLVFERAREEWSAMPRKSLRSAMTRGFKGAWSAVADSNVTTLIAAGLLFWLGSGPVKGFGVTLAVGVMVSMFSALVVARALTELASRAGWVNTRAGVNGIGRPGAVRTRLLAWNPRLFRRPARWLLCSGLLVVLAVAGIVLRGVHPGVEFTGGRLMEFSTSRPVGMEAARDALAGAGYGDAEVTTSGDGELSVRTGVLDDDEAAGVRTALAGAGGHTEKLRDELIGPSLGDELKRNALIALGIAVVAQLCYLSVRFRLAFAAGAVGALLHDVVILVGAFAWLGRGIDGVFVAATLTVIGYSVNDSVVVFDRIRELRAKRRKAGPRETASQAVLQTVPRTVNTGMGALFILAALAVLGGDSLMDFALALLIGVVVGTYSSVLTAVPAALVLERGDRAPARSVTRGGRKPTTRARDNGARV
ncbi:protein translocase subunit SecD [Streptomyces sp. NPDC058045]|uniref:protein translocase subunit SecD n=1 Tax=Streptomyces sp. NPDC058045 TaxID=3346311 RepID=UPI0036EA94DF